jgi:biotin synthase
MIDALARQVIGGTSLSRPQVASLCEVSRRDLTGLFHAASLIRDQYVGKRARYCSIVSAKTGRCSEDCAFCSQSAHFDTHVQGRRELEEEQVLEAAAEAERHGADSFGIVNSGYGPTDDEIERWGRLAGRIGEMSGLRACASLGILSDDQTQRLSELGVERYNHNLQTSRRHFPQIIKTHTYQERLATLRGLARAGISVCSGALFGMGESWSDRVDLALELRDLDPDVGPLNFLIPSDGTPLAANDPLAPLDCLHIIAVYRFCLPRQEIKIAGGRELNLRDLQSWIFLAGADSMLVGNYLTTCGRSPEDDRQMLRDLGLQHDDRDQPGHAPPQAAERPLPVLNQTTQAQACPSHAAT